MTLHASVSALGRNLLRGLRHAYGPKRVTNNNGVPRKTELSNTNVRLGLFIP